MELEDWGLWQHGAILAPGTTGSHQSFFPKKIYLAVSEIGSFPVLSNRFQRDASKLFRQQLVELRDVFRLRKQLANLRQPGHGECAQFIQLRPERSWPSFQERVRERCACYWMIDA